jgi:hypothetical protein
MTTYIESADTRTTEPACRSDIFILFCSAGHGFVAATGESLTTSHSHIRFSPATPRSLTASNGSERENPYGNQEIQQCEPYEKIRSEEKFQQKEVEHQKI